MSVQLTSIHNLPPQTTRFIGRTSEITEIVNRLQDESSRLLTLVGTGGIGKTRLAIESITHLVQSGFEHGVFYVQLAPLNSSDAIVTTVINALGIIIGDKGAPREELLKFLSQRNLLLVMDNFEHLLDGSAIVADILNTAPNIKILVTSREVLNLSMEHVWHVHGMRYPDIQDPEDINQYDALILFIERAMQIRRDFSAGDEQNAVIQICRLVDGLPLAIELAASWLKTLSCRDIIKQIERSIDFLATRNRDVQERHRSIFAVFDHSWNLLTPDEQAAFPRLAIFRGGFTLEAAEKVADADLMTLSSLVEKSMLRHELSGRYDIHELVRQYAQEHLINIGEVQVANEKYLDYFADFMASRVPDLKGRRQVDSLNEIRADFNNIYASWELACDLSAYDKLDEMRECLAIYFEIMRYPPIANEMYASALSRLESLSEPIHDRLRNWLTVSSRFQQFRRGILTYSDHIPDDIRVGLRVAEQYDDKLTMLMCLIIITIVPRSSQLHPETQAMLAVAESLGAYYRGWAVHEICYHCINVQKDSGAITRQYLKQFLEITQQINDVDGIALAYIYMATYASLWGNIDDAIHYYEKAIEGFEQNNIKLSISDCKIEILFMMFRKGRFAHVLDEIPHILEQLNSLGYWDNYAYMYVLQVKMYVMMAKVDALLGNYERSKPYLQKARSVSLDSRTGVAFQICEAETLYAIGSDDFEAVRRSITQALEIDRAFIEVRLMTDFLPLLAFLYHHDRHYTKAVEVGQLHQKCNN